MGLFYNAPEPTRDDIYRQPLKIVRK